MQAQQSQPENTIAKRASLLDRTGLGGNPVFQKDFQARLKMRRMPKWLSLLIRLGIPAVIVLVYGIFLTDIFGGEGYSWRIDNLGSLLLGWMTFFAYVLPPALASGSITLERENQTWNALLLSRLKPAEIVLGKFWAALLPIWGLGLVALPLGIIITAMSEHTAWWQLGAAVLGYLSISAFGTAMSLFSSWICRRTAIANGVSIALIALYHGFCGIAIAIVAYIFDKLHITVPNWLEYGYAVPWLIQPFLTFILLQLMIKRLYKGGKEKE